jgi:hypothetical protein
VRRSALLLLVTTVAPVALALPAGAGNDDPRDDV